MKYLILLGLLSCAFAQFPPYRGFIQNAYTTARPPPVRPNFQAQPNYQPQYNSGSRPFIGIRSQKFDISPDGSYSFSYETDNGIGVSESGYPKGTGQGQSENVEGTFTYTAPDGTPIRLDYTADENGFHPQGAHLPTPPPIPEAIRRALAVLPPGPDDDDSGRYNPQDFRTTRPPPRSFGTPYRRF